MNDPIDYITEQILGDVLDFETIPINKMISILESRNWELPDITIAIKRLVIEEEIIMENNALRLHVGPTPRY